MLSIFSSLHFKGQRCYTSLLERDSKPSVIITVFFCTSPGQLYSNVQIKLADFHMFRRAGDILHLSAVFSE